MTCYGPLAGTGGSTKKGTQSARTEISVTTRKCSHGSTSWLFRSGRASSQIQTALGATHSARTSHARADTAPVRLLLGQADVAHGRVVRPQDGVITCERARATP